MASSDSLDTLFPLTLARNRDLLDQLGEPRSLYQAFLWCSERPRVSAHLSSFAEDLLALGTRLGCTVEQDPSGNVLWRHAGTPGHQGLPVVCLQAHQDMVCSANEGTQFDFHSEPIHCVLSADKQSLKAQGTTLGADNAIGIAACVALLADPLAVFPPLECIFTTDEETTMAGAENLLPAPFLKAAYLFNLDSEEHGSICVGCAGGFEVNIQIPIIRSSSSSSSTTTTTSSSTSSTSSSSSSSSSTVDSLLKLDISGLIGGHTGVDIHRGRANAIVLLARLLSTLKDDLHPRLLHLDGGSVINTLPRSAHAHVALPSASLEAARAAVLREWQVILGEYQLIESAMQLLLTESHCAATDSPLDEASTKKAVQVLLCHPHGPLRLQPHNAAEVSTSISLSIASLKADHLFVHPFARSDSAEQMDLVFKKLQALALLAGGTITQPFNAFPGWAPNIRSPAYAAVHAAAERVYGHAPRVYSVHAGLEVGFFAGKYPDMHCVSFGPQIHDAHTPDERLELGTVQPFFDLLKSSLKNLVI